MMVWVSHPEHSHKRSFHLTEDCRWLSTANDVQAYELEDLKYVEPCAKCFPTAPRAPKVWRVPCRTCNRTQIYPCEHNGGIAVRIPVKYSKRGFQIRYVWPENAHYYSRV